MAALTELFNNSCFVGVGSLPSLLECRQKTCVIRRLGVCWGYAPEDGEQQRQEPLPSRPQILHYYLKFCPEHFLVTLL